MQTVSEATWLRKQNICIVTIRMKVCPVTIIRFKKEWQHGRILPPKQKIKLKTSEAAKTCVFKAFDNTCIASRKADIRYYYAILRMPY